MKLLLVEDDVELSKAVLKILKISGYDVDTAFDGEEALYYIDCATYDGIILDIMMPKIDGIQVLKKMRSNNNNTPVLILTAKAETDDIVVGLDAGADDYLTKPFVVKELLARIRALIRRKGEINEGVKIGDLTLDHNTFELKTSSGSTRLTNREYRLMEHLIRNKDVLVSTDSIMTNVWEYDSEAEINVVWVYISSLRKKLEEIKAPYEIKAIRGVGYKLEEKK